MMYHAKVKKQHRPLVKTSKDAHRIFRRLWSGQIGLLEECHLLLQDRALGIMGHMLLSKGSYHHTIPEPRIIFACALKARASAIIIAHNHPSGYVKPSQDDICITQKIVEAGDLLNIPLNDHLILAPDDNYYSFADEDMLESLPF